ncbi:MAG TPA: linear amide C-N hydrolase [Candidatus Krumholzibacteria bacterium]
MARLVFVLMFDMSFGPAASACTTFCYADGGTLVFGRNYDWMVGDGLVMVNKRGVTKRALTADAAAAQWTSKYGSLTFNQYGREFPTGGMNEKGLVVELMWLDDTRYPDPDTRGALPTLQWIQYQLDNAATVGEVIASDRAVRISSAGSAKIHFLVADAAGGVAAIEFLDGRLVAHRGGELPYPVLTNDTYDRSVRFARSAGARSGKSSTESLDRFARAASYRPDATSPALAVRNAFATLDDVAQGDHTKWSIVYDIGAKRVYFRTHAARKVRWIDVASLGFACHRGASMLDINAALGGDVTAGLQPYDPGANRALVNTAFAKTPFLAGATAEERDELARYPETTVCAGAERKRGGK